MGQGKIGWDGRTRTYEMPESKSGALPTWLHPKMSKKTDGWAGRTRTYGMPESESGALPTWLQPNVTVFNIIIP